MSIIRRYMPRAKATSSSTSTYHVEVSDEREHAARGITRSLRHEYHETETSLVLVLKSETTAYIRKYGTHLIRLSQNVRGSRLQRGFSLGYRRESLTSKRSTICNATSSCQHARLPRWDGARARLVAYSIQVQTVKKATSARAVKITFPPRLKGNVMEATRQKIYEWPPSTPFDAPCRKSTLCAVTFPLNGEQEETHAQCYSPCLSQLRREQCLA